MNTMQRIAALKMEVRMVEDILFDSNELHSGTKEHLDNKLADLQSTLDCYLEACE